MSRRPIESAPVASPAGREQSATNLAAVAIVWRESDVHVALCPEFDVASQGTTASDARMNLEEALELFLDHSSPEERKRRWRPAVE